MFDMVLITPLLFLSRSVYIFLRYIQILVNHLRWSFLRKCFHLKSLTGFWIRFWTCCEDISWPFQNSHVMRGEQCDLCSSEAYLGLCEIFMVCLFAKRHTFFYYRLKSVENFNKKDQLQITAERNEGFH